MIKVLIWQVLNNRNYLDSALKTLERQHNGIELVGVTADAETSLVYEGKNVTFIPLDKLTGGGYDLILVVGTRWKMQMVKVFKHAAQFNLPEEKLLGDWIVCIPGFTLDKYRELQRSRPSIFASNCIGGFFSNTLGLPFRSPFVNLWLPSDDFFKFMREPRSYLEKSLTYKGKTFDSRKTFEFPVAMLGDITLYMMHYKTFEESVEAWEKRKQRINWDNLLVMMLTSDKKILEQFDALPYTKKICFVAFKSELPSAWYIEPRLTEQLPRFVDIINAAAQGNPFYYDPFDMLLYGKKTPLIDMD